MMKICKQYYNYVGKKIKFYRTLRKLTQEKLSDLVGISANYLSRIERSDIDNLPLSTLFSLAKALNIPACYLIDFSGCKNREEKVDYDKIIEKDI